MLPSITKILYATDLSETARHALGYAAALADRHDAALTVLHVLPDSLEQLSEQAGMDLTKAFGSQAANWIDQGDMVRAIQAIHQRLEALTKEHFADPKAASRMVDAKIKVVCGDAADCILAESAREHFDIIVMGTHGQTGLMGILLGSVAKETVRASKVPVLVVPLPDEE